MSFPDPLVVNRCDDRLKSPIEGDISILILCRSIQLCIVIVIKQSFVLGLEDKSMVFRHAPDLAEAPIAFSPLHSGTEATFSSTLTEFDALGFGILTLQQFNFRFRCPLLEEGGLFLIC